MHVGTGAAHSAKKIGEKIPMETISDHTYCFIDLFHKNTSQKERERRLKILMKTYGPTLTETLARRLSFLHSKTDGPGVVQSYLRQLLKDKCACFDKHLASWGRKYQS